MFDDAYRASVTVGAKTVVTYRWGTGERPILLVHGWQSRASRFAGFVPPLVARGYSPIAFDAPGHGDSPGNATTILEYRDIVSRLADQYGVFEAVIAHSFGVLATFVALREGDHVQTRRLIAISGVTEFEYLLETFCSRLRLRAQLNQQLRARIEHDLFADEANIWERFSATYRPAEIPIPILVVHDENDDITDITQSQRIITTYRDQVRTLITQELGHRTLREPSILAAAGEFVGSSDL